MVSDESDFDLLPEYCRYQDDGCEFADSCLNCPFPECIYDRLGRLEDKNIDSVAGAEERGESYMRGVEMAAVNGAILTPVNCGQQLYDVIDITDSRAGLAAAKRRVNGLTLVYSPRRGDYRQRLLLGGA